MSANSSCWYDHAQRDLPWRASGCHRVADPGQRIHVATDPGGAGAAGLGWTGWLAGPRRRRPPRPASADVLRAWGKLGYPQTGKATARVRRRVIAREHGDVVPAELDVLLTLPGVGAYTARAVACFAYRQPVLVVDTNVRRVVARAVHGSADAGPSASHTRDLADVAALLPGDAAGTALLGRTDGAGLTIGTARTPRCGLCPFEGMRLGAPPATPPRDRRGP